MSGTSSSGTPPAYSLPARPRKPQDKAKVETGVLIVERWILARLRNHRFYSLGELNKAIKKLVADLNDRPFKKLPGTRREWFERLDRPVLRPLPPRRYEVAMFKQCRVNVNYHVKIDGHYYSVPHALVRKAATRRAAFRPPDTAADPASSPCRTCGSAAPAPIVPRSVPAELVH